VESYANNAKEQLVILTELSGEGREILEDAVELIINREL
jgi:hypothetical protein